jgi:hypothetical protein
MDRKTEFWTKAKQILNHNNASPYSNDEIREIVKLLDAMSDMICDNLAQSKI